MVTEYVLNKLLQHVGLSWIIESNQKLEYNIGEHNPDWLINSPWYNTHIWTKLHGTVLEKYIRNVRSDRYNPMCYIVSHDKQHP